MALKLDAVGLAHKSDVGAVVLGLVGDEAVRHAADAFEVRGLLVQPMADPGIELIVGLRRDSSFGPAVIVGLGGVLAEVLDDVAIRLAPVDAAEALSMLDSLRGRRLLDGVRGAPAIDRQSVAELIVALSRLGASRSDIVEIDLDPVIASPTGFAAVDALVVLRVDPGGADHV